MRMLQRLLGVLAILIVCALVFELTTRLDDWVRFGTALWSPYAVEEDLLMSDSLGEHGRPHARFQKWELNNLGMRGPDVSVQKSPGVVRVVTAGASETFGLYETPGREFPRQLEDSLRLAFAANACTRARVEVINAAIFGMTLPSIDQDLEMRVAPLRPDIVVLYPTPVQYLDDELPHPAPRRTGSAESDPAWYAPLRPRAAGELRNQLKAMLPVWAMTWLRHRDVSDAVASHDESWRFSSVPVDRLQRYEMDLRHTLGTIRRIGAAPILMTHADVLMTDTTGSAQLRAVHDAQLAAWERIYPRATGATIEAFDSAAVAVTVRAGRDSGAEVVDLARSVRGTASPAAARLFGDYAHFTDVGSALVASELRVAVLPLAERAVGCQGTGSLVSTANLKRPTR
jgi:hypothetical protein